MMNPRFVKISGLLTIGLLALGACRAEEQGRVIRYEPGVYKGKPDTELTAEQSRALRQRSMYPSSDDGAAGRDVTRPEPIGPSAQEAYKPEARVDRAKARAVLNSRIRFQRDSGI